jgi:hypothetical protein
MDLFLLRCRLLFLARNSDRLTHFYSPEGEIEPSTKIL